MNAEGKPLASACCVYVDKSIIASIKFRYEYQDKSRNKNHFLLLIYNTSFQKTPFSSSGQGGASARLSEVKNESRRDFTPTPH